MPFNFLHFGIYPVHVYHFKQLCEFDIGFTVPTMHTSPTSTKLHNFAQKLLLCNIALIWAILAFLGGFEPPKSEKGLKEQR